MSSDSLRYQALCAALALAAPATAAADAPGAAPISVEKLSADKLPKALAPRGDLDSAFRFRDKNGDNYLVVSTVDKAGDDTKSRYLYVVHGACQGAACRTLRELKDQVEDCGEDITLDFDAASVDVTDLDRNGLDEVAFAYRVGCRGDIGPADLKLMLLENGQKYAIRGSDTLIHEGKKIGGEMKPDPAFKKAPPAFLDHAKALWKKDAKTTRM